VELRSAQFRLAAYGPDQFPRDGFPQFAVAGRSNVGKSSLLNTILGNRKLARISQTPGKTQAIQFYLVNGSFYIVDLPGYGYAKVSRSIAASWGPLIRDYLEQEASIRKLFLLLDSRRTPSDHDLELVDWLEESGVEWQAVLTKVDKLSSNKLLTARRSIARAIDQPESELILFSSVKKRGVDEIWRTLAGEFKK